MRRILHKRNGQALVMVTLALLAMFGVIGLAVDLGWSFYVKKSAQAAADAAALAAVLETLNGAGTGTYTCGSPNVDCWTTPQPCPAPPITNNPASNIDNGCLYAQQNGFAVGGAGGAQNVTMQSNVPASGCFPNCIPTAPGVHAYYWVTARVSQQIPQLFSAILGNAVGTSSARATAAIADVVIRGSLILLNRINDPVGPNAPPQGTDLFIGGQDTISVPGGILLASKSTAAGDFGGKGGGQGQVITPFTYIQGANGQGGLPQYAQSRWQNWYQNQPDGIQFRDPFEGKGQPPLTNASTSPIPVPGGDLSKVCPVQGSAFVCGQGIYYAADANNNATGAALTLSAVKVGQQTISTYNFNGGSFGEFTFFGGFYVPGNQGGFTVDFGPGEYVMAGSLNTKSPGNGMAPVFETNNAATITGGGLGQNNQFIDQGRLFILTDSTYPGLQSQVSAVKSNVSSLGGVMQWGGTNNDYLYFGTSDFKAGVAGGKSSVDLWGLDKSVSHSGFNDVGYTLQDFQNIVIWQDQRNSNIKYTTQGQPNVTDGTYDWTSCGPGYDIENVCLNPTADRHMELSANQSSHLEGIVYQPRGSTVTIWAGTGYTGPISIVSGGLVAQGNVTLTLNGPLQPLTRRVAALVE